MEKILTPVDIITKAIAGEEAAAVFYEKMADLMKNELVKTKYKSLAQEEVGHRELLINMYKKLTGSNYQMPQNTNVSQTAEGGLPVAITDSITTALEFAIAREEEAKEFYQESASATNDPTNKRILEYLADIEDGHALMLKKELRAYRRDQKWYKGE